jgi:hypothetical protein
LELPLSGKFRAKEVNNPAAGMGGLLKPSMWHRDKPFTAPLVTNAINSSFSKSHKGAIPE